ncbi:MULTISPECIES: hypothetical protein [unclassified Microcoleus]|uniref:hypothetical protein n=1 Tax=unclassified Microcoleus TaxID=2642155 RepID=UPI002FD0BE29
MTTKGNNAIRAKTWASPNSSPWQLSMISWNVLEFNAIALVTSFQGDTFGKLR